MFAIFDKTHRLLPRIILSFVFAVSLFISLLYPASKPVADTLAAGLKGEYFDNEDFTSLKLTRTDTAVDFNWVFNSPDSTINSENFSVRWTGQLTPSTSGNYVLVTQSDDGVRLWLGNQLVIDNFTPHALTEDRSAVIALTGGQSYNLRLEYFELTANAIIRLMWIRPGQTTPEVIPLANLATPVNPNPAPTLSNLSPTIIPSGTANATLTVNGSSFLQGAVVQFNNSARTTTFVSSTQLTATLQVSDLAFAAQAKITAVNPLPGGGTSNPLTLTVSGGFEADVAPRPNGTNNGTITIADWTQLGRFASGLDVVTVGNEYQRADCAPRSSLGDGRITLTDWVQAGRYATALDPVTGAGGPTAPANGFQVEQTDKSDDDQISKAQNSRRIYSFNQSPNSVAVVCEGQGDENAFGFSFRFDTSRWELLSVSAGPDAGDAKVFANTEQAFSGVAGLVLALPPNGRFAVGQRRIAVLTFQPRLGNIAPFSPVTIEFADHPIAREVVSAEAQNLCANFVSGFYSQPLARLGSASRQRQRH
ncbi:MAG: PA14 domain-containing protein [Acidobacteriota bacterium]|nr:PA14 domain-containing protein [Acidobacteriota bacterium]